MYETQRRWRYLVSQSKVVVIVVAIMIRWLWIADYALRSVMIDEANVQTVQQCFVDCCTQHRKYTCFAILRRYIYSLLPPLATEPSRRLLHLFGTVCRSQYAVSTGIAVTASFSQQTDDRAFCPVVQLFRLRASLCTDYHVTSLLLFLRVTCPCSLRTYATFILHHHHHHQLTLT